MAMLDREDEIHAAEHFGSLKDRLRLGAHILAEQYPAVRRLERQARRLLRPSGE